jgi:hypothetical protein
MRQAPPGKAARAASFSVGASPVLKIEHDGVGAEVRREQQ